MMPGTAATRFALAISPVAFTLGSQMTARKADDQPQTKLHY